MKVALHKRLHMQIKEGKELELQKKTVNQSLMFLQDILN